MSTTSSEDERVFRDSDYPHGCKCAGCESVFADGDTMHEREAGEDTVLVCATCSQPKVAPEAQRSLEWRRRKIASMAKATEHRSFPAASLEIRTLDTGTMQLTGYASVYGVEYDMGWYSEEIAAGAGKRSLSENPDVQLLLNHDSLPLARTVSGTLRLSEDTHGLYVEADLDPEDLDVQALVRKNRRGDLDQMSFAFRTTDDSWDEELTKRTIRSYSIHRGDVSVVNYGANPATSVSVRSADTINGVIGILEQRAGKTLPAATAELLTRALNADTDDAMDEIKPLLADLLAAPAPETEPLVVDERVADEPEPLIWALPEYTTREHERLLILQNGRRR